MDRDGSPSSRRAWIEIRTTASWQTPLWVALLTEGVDRNNGLPQSATGQYESPSSRRAWIEIHLSV